MIKPRFDGKRFSYPTDMEMGSHRDALRWALTRKPVKWPRNLTNPPADKVIERIVDGSLRLTYINHATVLIQCDGLNLITDPVFSKRVSPVSFAGPKRYRPAGLAIEDLPPIDVILISHSHYDHLDVRSLRQLCIRDNPQVIAPLNHAALIDSVCTRPTVELSWWDSYSLDETSLVTLVPARHWTSRKPGDANQALWGGHVIRFSSGALYFAGDTGYGDGDHFRQACEHLGPFRCALLPIGAYEPRWFMKPQHMNPAEAVKAFRDLQAAYALGIHHGTFQLTDEGVDDPVNALHLALADAQISRHTFTTLANGAAWDVPPQTTA